MTLLITVQREISQASLTFPNLHYYLISTDYTTDIPVESISVRVGSGDVIERGIVDGYGAISKVSLPHL